MKPPVPIKPSENKPKNQSLLLVELGVVVQACHPSTQDAEVGEASELEASPLYTERFCPQTQS